MPKPALRAGLARPGFGVVEMAFVALLLSVAVLGTAFALLNTVKAAPNEVRCESGRQYGDNIAADSQAAQAVDGQLGATGQVGVGGAVSAQSDGSGVKVKDSACTDSAHSVYVPLAAPVPMPT